MDEAKLLEIKSYETESNHIISRAERECGAILALAQEEGEELLEKEKTSVRERSKKLMEDSRSEGLVEADKLLSGLGKALKDLEEKSGHKKDQAVKLVLEKLIHYQ